MPAIYQSDVFCDSCAEEIKLQLTKAGKKPENPDDETTYDSDEYPKYMGENEESDTPQHCGGGEYCLEAQEIPDTTKKVGKLLNRTLTDDGVEYVKEATGVVADWWRKEFTKAGYDVIVTIDEIADELIIQWINGNKGDVYSEITKHNQSIALTAKVAERLNTRAERNSFANFLVLKSED